VICPLHGWEFDLRFRLACMTVPGESVPRYTERWRNGAIPERPEVSEQSGAPGPRSAGAQGLTRHGASGCFVT